MHLISLLALAGPALAANFNHPALHARQDMDDLPQVTVTDPACIAALASLGSDYPTPPPELIEHANDNNGCITSVPDSLTDESSSYQSSLSSWAEEHSDDVESAREICTDIEDDIDDIIAECTGGGGGGGDDDDDSDSDDDSSDDGGDGDASGSEDDDDAAPQVTAMAFAAMAAAGGAIIAAL